VKFDLQNGTAMVRMAAWDQEGSNRLEKSGPKTKRIPVIQSRFLRWHSNERRIVSSVKTQAAHMENQASAILIHYCGSAISSSDTTFRTQQTTSEAISLLQKSIDRTAAQWEPVLRSSAADSSAQKRT